MTYWQLRELADQVRTIPLESVLRQSGAQPDRYDQRKWHTPLGVLSVTGAKFMNWTCGHGGGGAIDLVIHLHGLRFQEAVQWLHLRFPEAVSAEPTDAAEKPALALPPPDPSKLWRVRRYLVQERRLPYPLVDSLIQSGHLYADGRANAVFLLLGKENKPVGAELRGTTVTPLAWPGSRLSKRPWLFCHPQRSSLCDYLGGVSHRRDQLLCSPPTAPLHLHSRGQTQSGLAGATPWPRLSRLLRL